MVRRGDFSDRTGPEMREGEGWSMKKGITHNLLIRSKLITGIHTPTWP